jgi:hypothetical protein
MVASRYVTHHSLTSLLIATPSPCMHKSTVMCSRPDLLPFHDDNKRMGSLCSVRPGWYNAQDLAPYPLHDNDEVTGALCCARRTPSTSCLCV